MSQWAVRIFGTFTATTMISSAILATHISMCNHVVDLPKDVATDKTARALSIWMKKSVAGIPYAVKWRYEMDQDIAEVMVSISFAQFLIGQRSIAKKDLDLSLLTTEALSELAKSLRDDELLE
jgi:hypothetical protein